MTVVVYFLMVGLLMSQIKTTTKEEIENKDIKELNYQLYKTRINK